MRARGEEKQKGKKKITEEKGMEERGKERKYAKAKRGEKTDSCACGARTSPTIVKGLWSAWIGRFVDVFVNVMVRHF